MSVEAELLDDEILDLRAVLTKLYRRRWWLIASVVVWSGALVAYALQWAHTEGFESMTVDWREVNLLASRFWPRRGFRPTFYRLYRHIP